MTSADTYEPNGKPLSLPFLQNGGECGALLRQTDWSRHPLGTPDQWPVVLQTTVGIILGSPQPMYVCWGPDFHMFYNDAYAMLCGKRHPAAQSMPFAEVWHDIMETVGPLMAQVRAGESVNIDDLQLTMYRHGYPEEAHFSFSYTPMRDAGNAVVGLFCTCQEITCQVNLQRDLAHERGRLGQMFEQSPSFIAMLEGPDHIFTFANPLYMRLIGQRDVIGKPLHEAFGDATLQPYLQMLRKVYETGKAKRVDGAKISFQREPHLKPQDRYVDFVYQPVRDASGKVTGVFVDGIDVTDRLQALSDLQSSEQFLQSVLGASSDCIKVLDMDGVLIFINTGGRLAMEMHPDASLQGSHWPDQWKEPGHTDARKALAAARQGSSTTFQGYADTAAGNRRYWDVRVTPMLDAQGQADRILVVSRDITYLKRIEEEREQVMNEVSHRLKNAFGMVQSVINQTLRQAASLEQGRDVLSGRIRALAGAQDILTQSIASEMQISAVVVAALLPHYAGEDRFVIGGPVITINGRQSLGLSLALHELATNATKYGALSGDVGRVTINWDIQPDGAFSFDWQESGGPHVTQPARSGFGSVLIEKIVATYFDGAATLDFRPAGVVFRLAGVIAPPDARAIVDPY